MYFRDGIVNPGARKKKNRDGILAGFILTLTLKKKKITANAFCGHLQVAISLATVAVFHVTVNCIRMCWIVRGCCVLHGSC